MLLQKTNGQWVQWNGLPINGVRHPRSIESAWPDAELNAIGLFRPVGTPPTESHTPAGYDDTADVPLRVFTAPSSEEIEAREKQVTLERLRETDIQMARAAEDMWDAVKQATGATDDSLPEAVRALLAERRALREQLPS